jgi:hypothetical protein
MGRNSRPARLIHGCHVSRIVSVIVPSWFYATSRVHPRTSLAMSHERASFVSLAIWHAFVPGVFELQKCPSVRSGLYRHRVAQLIVDGCLHLMGAWCQIACCFGLVGFLERSRSCSTLRVSINSSYTQLRAIYSPSIALL